jgi:hypothetical protein
MPLRFSTSVLTATATAIPSPVVYLDANDPASYPGSGTTVTDLSGNDYTHTLTGATYTVLNGVKCFDCTTGTKRVVVNGTGPTLPTSGYTYITWARLEAGNPASFRTLLYTNSPRYTPITIPNGTNTLGYWDTEFRSSGYDLASAVGVWVQYAVVGDNSSQTFYINGSQAGNSIAYGAGGTTHFGWGANHTIGQPWGYVANMFLYTDKLTQEHIQQNYYALQQRFATSAGYVTSGLQFNLQTAPTSGTTWTDSSGNGRNATLVGSPSYVSNNGGGIRLNNENGSGTDYISVPYNIASNTVTVEVVASFNPTSFWGTIWGNEVYDTSGGYLAYLNSSTEIGYGIPNSETTVTITASNAIRHWIFVINGTQASLFLNGSQVGTTDTIGNQTIFATGDFYFGARHLNDGTGLTDTINNSNSADYPVFYQMRVYNKALSGAEITQNYNAVKGTYGL